MATGDFSMLQSVTDLLVQMQAEVAIFVVALLAHVLLFGKLRPPNAPKAKQPKSLVTSEAAVPITQPAEATASPSGAHQVTLVRRLGSQKRLDEAFSTIKQCNDKHAYLFNALLETCVEQKDAASAERVMSEAEAAGAADAVTYNTVLKSRLQHDSLQKAHETVRAMKRAGLKPNLVTFNQLIDGSIRSDIQSTWRFIDEMEACGVKPNHITASILLKRVQPSAKACDIERTMAVVDTMEDKMDDVLLSSVIEACVRTERIDLLAKQLRKLGPARQINPSSVTTYGSLIRAYGVLQDVPASWALWGRMSADGVAPTNITLGCMVEALVTNGEIEAGHELIRDMLGDATTRVLVNAVIYCSIIKGFSHMKRFELVWEVYQEMFKEGVEPSKSVFNALLDACVRCGKMNKSQSILEDMSRHGCEPNLVTYSSIIKGYCVDKNLEAALGLAEYMKKEKGICPDEVTWNTLLDGCARQGLCQRGMGLLNDMLEAGVPPSTFTLSVVVKLLERGRRVDEAFEICESLSQRFRFKLNSYVYNNLMQACIRSKDLPRAFETFERMLRDGSRPDTRSYTLLLQGSVSLGGAREAAGLLGSACGVPECVHPRLKGLSVGALKPTGGLPAEAVSEVLETLVRRGGGERDMAVKLFAAVRKMAPGLRVDKVLQTKLASEVIRTSGGAPRA